MQHKRIRGARAIANYYKRGDPETAVSETLIRRLMDSGEIPTFRSGSKRMTSIEAVENWISAHLQEGTR